MLYSHTVEPGTLELLKKWYDQMFHHSTSFHVIRSLTYFEDAELAEMPLVFDDKVTWESVKKRMIEVVKKNF